VRVALGATSRAIVGLVLRQGLLPAAGGALLGLAFAGAAGRALAALLAGVSPFDAATYTASVAVVLATALVGSALPALRALRVDPATALRAE
jgi:ABC-type antimicrobial peptide transport system permease subunit